MADMPDFSGTLTFSDIQPVRFFGDIGKIAASTFVLEVLPQLTFGDLWVTVFDASHHLIIEIQGDIRGAMEAYRMAGYGIKRRVSKEESL